MQAVLWPIANAISVKYLHPSYLDTSTTQELVCSCKCPKISTKAAIPNLLDWLKASDCSDHSLCAAQECAGMGITTLYWQPGPQLHYVAAIRQPAKCYSITRNCIQLSVTK